VSVFCTYSLYCSARIHQAKEMIIMASLHLILRREMATKTRPPPKADGKIVSRCNWSMCTGSDNKNCYFYTSVHR
jgi:hypothetical protein